MDVDKNSELYKNYIKILSYQVRNLFKLPTVCIDDSYSYFYIPIRIHNGVYTVGSYIKDRNIYVPFVYKNIKVLIDKKENVNLI